MSELPYYYLTLDQALQEFPAAAEWLVDHETAQLSETTGLRLPSAEERLEVAGGVERVRQDLADQLHGRNLGLIVMRACREQPIAVPEVERYVRELGVDKRRGRTAGVAALRLRSQGLLREVDTVTYLKRGGTNNSNVIVNPKRIGYQTTDDDLREYSRLLQSDQPGRGSWR